AQEATDHYRTLTATNPDAYLPDLAGALNNLAVNLGELGQHKKGLAVAQEATDHYRTLTATNPDAYLPDLAGALNNLAVNLGGLGQHKKGLAAAQEATDHYRTLTEANPDLFEAALQQSLEVAAWLEGLEYPSSGLSGNIARSE
ncbi:hypothetical protein ACIQOV_30775, partial [Kitasatospora sp. NPDC091257]